MSEPTKLLTTAQAAGRLGLKSSTLEAWRFEHRKGLPFVRIGRLCKYSERSIEAYIARQTEGNAV